MTAQPLEPSTGADRVPRTVDGIAQALSGARRMAFYRELGLATAETAPAVVRRWWAEAMLDTDPARDAIRAQVDNGTLPLSSWDEVIAKRRALGLPVE
ncbi:hypothetical protein BIV57_13510 [Mangrovactinospora gilvigrisea]|uniref:Uncharacterized protein n=1 Tax=Mangrovactinospora gilvigrisea TaxID=1428644 RepID=A0A1J7C617_9ACTN|nr:hypothetical protein [Mangrovactinospora gilvigrisea]OIV37000.1 hypothetical protein BIV57_13510 [Mangrovactinospora gilvigrisea]